MRKRVNDAAALAGGIVLAAGASRLGMALLSVWPL
jgi:hypothetical protein